MTTTIEVTTHVRAEPETVFRFFTDRDRFARWFAGPGGGVATIDPRPGGSLRMAFPGGAVAAGSVASFDPPRRFAFTWGYEEPKQGIPPGSTRVEISLTPAADGTIVTLTHSGLPTPEAGEHHVPGWRHYLALLARAATEDQHGAAGRAALDSYFKAWNTTDPAARRALLERCWAPGGRYFDAFASLAGADRLDAHLANAQRHMPGIRLELAGPPQESHGFVRAGWRALKPDGSPMATGVDFACLDLEGRITLLVGFWDAPGSQPGA